MAKIVQLTELLKNHLEHNKKIVDYNLVNLTEPGDNFGSTIQSLEVRTKNGHGDEENLHLVAKMYPLNPLTERFFNSPITFRKEIALYVIVTEELKKLHDEQGFGDLIDFFPKYYAGRLSLDPEADKGDKNAVFLLENLRNSNYVSVDRLKGFNLKTAQLIIKKLAILHASAIALQLKKPGLFQEKIMSALERAQLPSDLPPGADAFADCTIAILNQKEDLKRYSEKLRELLTKFEFYGTAEARPPFATIGHNDFWVNNILVRFEKEEPVQIKMVDFQVTDYGSPARDLIFFLFSSVQRTVLEQNIDGLIDLYFKTFVETLDKFGIDPEHKIFTKDEFEKEMKIEGPSQYVHVAIMVQVILRKRGTVKPLDEMNEDEMKFDINALSEDYPPNILYVTTEFAKRNWLY